MPTITAQSQKVRKLSPVVAGHWPLTTDHLAEGIYVASTAFPKTEVYGLGSQIRKAAVSVAANVAEGQGRRSTAEFQHFLSIAQGSLSEVETHMLIAQRLRYLADPEGEQLLKLSSEIGRMINGLRKSLEHQPRKR